MDFVLSVLAFFCGVLVGCLGVYVYHHKLSLSYDIATIKSDIENLVLKCEHLFSKIP